MAFRKYINNVSTTLDSAINGTQTTFNVAVGDGALFGTLQDGEVIIATLESVDLSNLEIVEIVAISGDTLEVIRAREGTTGQSFLAGDKIELRITAQALNQAQNNFDTVLVGPNGVLTDGQNILTEA